MLIAGIIGLLVLGAAATGVGGFLMNDTLSKRNAERMRDATDYEYEKLGRRAVTFNDLIEKKQVDHK